MGILPIPRTHKAFKSKKNKRAPPNPPHRGGLRRHKEA